MNNVLYSSVKEKFQREYLIIEQYYKLPSQIFSSNFRLPSNINLQQRKEKSLYDDLLLINIPEIPPEVIWRLEQADIHSSLDFLNNSNIKYSWKKLGITQPSYKEVFSLISSYTIKKNLQFAEYKFKEFLCIVNCTYQNKTTSSIYLSPILLTLTSDAKKNHVLTNTLLKMLPEFEAKYLFLVEIKCSLLSSFVTNQIDTLQHTITSLSHVRKLAKIHKYFLPLFFQTSEQMAIETVIALFYILCCSSGIAKSVE